MEKLSLTKTIEAKKLNKRTGVPTTDPEVTIPFGSFVENLELDRDMVKFTYHGEPYRCTQDLLLSALGRKSFDEAAAGEAVPEPAAPPAPAGAPAAAAAAPAACEKPKLQWEPVESTHYSVMRARVPGGWLVSTGGATLTFCPDPAREW